MTPLAVLNTYTYGTRQGKSKDILDTTTYKAQRTPSVINAENKLGPANPSAEQHFQSLPTHSRKDISQEFPSQRVVSSVYATPRGGTHRIDTYDASISISGVYTGDMSSAQKDAILARSGAIVQNQFDTIKKQFNTPTSFTLEEYKAMLNTGTVSPVLEKAGFSWSTPPQFFEARAMVHGNVCANRVDGIALGRLAYKGSVQPSATPTSIEDLGSAGVGTTGVIDQVSQTTIGAGIGINTRRPQQKPPEKQPTTDPGNTP